MAKKFLTGIRLLNLTEDPAAGVEGEVYFNTTTFATRIYADGEWKYLSESAEELLVQIKNTTGSTINKGTPVYITGSVGGSTVLTVGLADASSASAMPAVGLVVSNLSNNTEGFAQVGGFFRQFTTSPIDGQTPSPNSTVYVKAGGGLTLTKPTGTNLIQNIAKVARVHGSAGSLIVSSIMRTNDIPNIPENKFWLGNSSGVPSAVDFSTEVNRSASATYLTKSSASTIYSPIGETFVNTGVSFPEHRPGALHFNEETLILYMSYLDNWYEVKELINITLDSGDSLTTEFSSTLDGGLSNSSFSATYSGDTSATVANEDFVLASSASANANVRAIGHASSASATAFDFSRNYTDSSISSASTFIISSIVASAPETLNTLNELALALNNDASFASTVTNTLSTKLDAASASATYATINQLSSASANVNTLALGYATSASANANTLALTYAASSSANADVRSLGYISSLSNSLNSSSTILSSRIDNIQSASSLFLTTATFSASAIFNGRAVFNASPQFNTTFDLPSGVTVGGLPIGTGAGATGGGTDKVFYENDTIVTTSYTITAGKNALTAGPVTINNGVIITIPAGSTWIIL